MKHSSGMSSACPLFAKSLHRLKMFGPMHFVWLIDGPVLPFAVFALFRPLFFSHSSSVCGVMSVSAGLRREVNASPSVGHLSGSSAEHPYIFFFDLRQEMGAYDLY